MLHTWRNCFPLFHAYTALLLKDTAGVKPPPGHTNMLLVRRWSTLLAGRPNVFYHFPRLTTSTQHGRSGGITLCPPTIFQAEVTSILSLVFVDRC